MSSGHGTQRTRKTAKQLEEEDKAKKRARARARSN